MTAKEVCGKLKYEQIALHIADDVSLAAHERFKEPTDAKLWAGYAQYGSRCGNQIHYEVYSKNEHELAFALHDERSDLRDNDPLRNKLAQVADGVGFRRNLVDSKQFWIRREVTVDCRFKTFEAIVAEVEKEIWELYRVFECILESQEMLMPVNSSKGKSDVSRDCSGATLVDIEQIKSLRAVLLNDDKIKQLQSVLKRWNETSGQFNILNVLGLSDYEIRHSFMLRWLLDPMGNHGLGDSFLRAFMQQIGIANKTRDLSALESFGIAPTRIEVEREVDNIDLLLVDSDNKIVVVIENKWDAAEREDSDDQEGQLKKYVRLTTSRFPGTEWNRYYVFLTPTGRPPSEDNRDTWNVLGYEGVLKAIREIGCVLDKDTIANGVRVFVGHYEEIIKRKVEMESELKTLCNEIFREHEKELRYLYDNVDQSQLRHPILMEVSKGMVVGGEHLCGLGKARDYVQFKQRMPSDLATSVHYEITSLQNGDKIVVALHIEDKTDSAIREKIRCFIKETDPQGFRVGRKGSWVKKEIVAKGRNPEDSLQDVKRAFEDLHGYYEPILQQFETELRKAHG